MQYVLSEDEMAAISQERQDARKMPSLEALENVCKHIATTMIPTVALNGYKSDTPYGCIHVNRNESYGYCDRCPVQGICPLPKDYSK